MTILYHSALRRPRRTILVAALLLVAAAPGLLLLELGTDGRALVPRDAPAVRVDERIRAEFPAEDPIAVVIEASTPQGILSEGNLRLIRRLTEDLRALEGIDSSEVVSLATETGGRVRPGTLEFTSFLDPIPEGDERLEALRRDLHALPIYHGTLVSSDGGEELAGWSPSAAAILLGVPAGADRTLLHRRIVDTVSRLGEIPERIHVVGAPVAEALLGRHILHDLALLVPLVIAAMGLVFLLAFGTPAAAWPPLLEVGAAMVFVFGLIGYCGVPVYLTIAVLPVILSAIGVTDEIHIFSRYRRLLRERQHPAGHVEALRAALDDVWRPIVKTSVTSSIGFLSFTLSPVAPVRAFGVFTAAGIIFCMLWSLTVIPAILSLQDPRRFAAAGRSRSPQGEAPVEALVRLAIRFRWAVLAALAVALAAAPIGLRGLVVQDSWIDNFSPRSELRRSTERVNRLFSGVHSLRILVDARGAILSGDLAPHASEDPRSGLAELLTLEPDPAHRAGLDRWIGRRVVVQASPAAAGSSPSPSSSGGSTGLLDSREPLFTAQAIEVEQESGRARLILRRDDDPQLRPSRSRHLRDLSYSVAGT
ncbi:MAG: RND family transporter, partial [Planctomycetota bacterium]